METKVENTMTRHFTARRLATSLVSALLIVGAASPAFAQRQDKDDDQDERLDARYDDCVEPIHSVFVPPT